MLSIIIGAFLGGIIAEAVWMYIIQPALIKAEQRKLEKLINSLKRNQENKKNRVNKSKQHVCHQA